MNLSEHFTLEELTKSTTAKRLKIDNTPNEEGIAKLKKLCEDVLEPIRKEWGKPIIVNSGYRCVKLNKAVGGVSTSQHCFDRNTEILTDNGWKTYKTIEERDNVYSYNMNTGLIELTPIDDIIIKNFDGNLYYADNKHVNYAVTDEHRMLVRYDTHKYERKIDRELTEKEKAYTESLKTNNNKYHIEYAADIHKKRRYIKTSGITNNTNTYNIGILNLCMATISDGYLIYKKGKFSGIGFNLVKERDRKKLEDIFDSLNMPYNKCLSASHKNYEGSGKVYNYSVYGNYAKEVFQIIGPYKKIPRWFLSLRSDILKELVITYAYFDGSLDFSETHSNMTIFCTDEENTDMIQIMCVFSGMRCVKKRLTNQKITIKGITRYIKEIFNLSIVTNKDESRLNENTYKKFYYKSIVWCVSNCNSTVIIRRNGKVSIQGNCLCEAADICTLSNTKEDNKKLHDLIREMIDTGKIVVGQLINEYNYSWVHVSLPTSRHRNQILKIG